MPPLSPEELAQSSHYEQISKGYQQHYGDPTSQRYRDLFFHQPMFEGLPLRGARVLDGLCGGGDLSHFLHGQGARVSGLDISPSQLASYCKRNPECEAVCQSLIATDFADDSFDMVGVVGGLHHLPPHLEAALDEVYRILKPGGYLCFTEPHSGSLLDTLRRIWYRFDPLFEANEEAIDVAALKLTFADRFNFERERYFGNIAYITVWNSMVMRVPVSWKSYYSGGAIAMEKLLNRFLPGWLQCGVVCRWRKKS